MRNAAIDMEAAKEHKVVVCGTQYGRDPTAPLTMGLILELTRGIGRENARMHAGEPWQSFAGIEIEGRTLGVVGLGKLGSKVAALAKAFGMNVIAWSPNLTPEKCKEAGVGYATKEELFATADIITIHVVLSQRSRGLVGRDDLARMKPTAYLVNTARGPIVDEAALLEALQQKKIAGAGIDVFSVEPLPVDHPFRKLDNLVLTPHLGYATRGEPSRIITARWSNASTPGPRAASRRGNWFEEPSLKPITRLGQQERARARLRWCVGRASAHRDRRGQRRHRGRLRAGNGRGLRSDGGSTGRRRGGCGRRSRRRAARNHDDAGADLDAFEQVGDVLVQHADAARRDELADRRGLVGAVDAVDGRAEIHRAGAERVAGAAGHEARQIGLALDHLGRRMPVRPLGLLA